MSRLYSILGKRALFTVCSALVMLTGCGDSVLEDAQNEPNISTSVPSAAIAKIASISTADAVVDRKAPVVKPERAATANYFVLAADREGSLYLAAQVLPGEPVPKLSVETTAVALSFIAQGRLPPSMDATTFAQAVRSGPKFQELVLAIRSALERGHAPGEDAQVWKGLFAVLSDAAPTAATAPSGLAHRLASARPSVGLPLPHTILNGGPGNLRVTIAATAPDVKGVAVRNGLPIAFSLQGRTVDSDSLITFGLPALQIDGELRLPARTLVSTTTYTETEVPGDPAAWNLRLFRSDRAQREDIILLSAEVLGTALGGLFSNDCLKDFAEAFITSHYASFGLTGATSFQLDSWVRALGNASNWIEIASATPSCVADFSLKAGARETAALIAKFLALPLKVADLLVTGTELAGKVVYMGRYWSYDSSFGICQSGPGSALAVVDCPSRLEPAIASGSLQLGQTVSFGVLAFTSDGTAVEPPPPDRLRFSSSRQDILSIDANGAITVLAVSDTPVTVTAESVIFGLRASASFTVVVGSGVTVSLSANATRIRVGETVRLVWSSTNASACNASESWSGPTALSGSTTFTPAALGVYLFRLTCEGVGRPTSAIVSIEVLAPPPPPIPSLTLLERIAGVERTFDGVVDQASGSCPVTGGCAFVISYNAPATSTSSARILTLNFVRYPDSSVYFDLRYSGSRSVSDPGSFFLARFVCSITDPTNGPCSSLISVDSLSRRIVFNAVVLREFVIPTTTPSFEVTIDGSLAF